jgi:hypothetical protein
MSFGQVHLHTTKQPVKVNGDRSRRWGLKWVTESGTAKVMGVVLQAFLECVDAESDTALVQPFKPVTSCCTGFLTVLLLQPTNFHPLDEYVSNGCLLPGCHVLKSPHLDIWE